MTETRLRTTGNRPPRPTRRPGVCLTGLLGAVPLLLGLLPGCTRGPAITLTRGSESAYSIVLSSNADSTDARAARELQHYLHRISGAELPIVVSEIGIQGRAIYLAAAGRSGRLPVEIEFDALEEDGFALRTAGADIVIAGGTEKGLLYGVYELLTSHLGCRLYAPEAVVIPEQSTITLPRLNDVQVPVLTFRSTNYAHAYSNPYRDWHRLDDGNEDRYLEWSTRVHTFKNLVPPEEYFADHPEYFSQIAGERSPSYQLCLTNPDVYDIVVARLLEMMAGHPEVTYWSVSQNDTYGPCECAACRALDEAEGGPIGSLLHFVNRVADEFPDKIITTLAYQYSRSAPRNLRPRPNVSITLCSIECDRSVPIDSSPRNAAFRHDVEAWSAIAPRIQIWDYVVQFSSIVSPFPNLHVLQPNIRFFVRNGIDAVFEQGSGGLRGEFTWLRSWLIAKLLWNPEADVDALIDDFLAGYYGPAAPWLRRYIDTTHRTLRRSGARLDIYKGPREAVDTYLTPRLMDRYERFFARAAETVADDPVFSRRLREARLPLEFARLEQAKLYGTGELGFFERTPTSSWRVRPAMRQLLDEFVTGCEAAGVTRLDEHGVPPAEYRQRLERLFDVSMQDHLALNRPVEVLTTWSEKYPANGIATFTDGLKGVEDWTCNWLGFEGHDMTVVIDLESISCRGSTPGSGCPWRFATRSRPTVRTGPKWLTWRTPCRSSRPAISLRPSRPTSRLSRPAG